jgi:hypothetical protein
MTTTIPEPLGVIFGQGEIACTAERPIVGGWLHCNYEAGHSEPGHLDGRTNRVWGLPDEGSDWANDLSRKQRAVLAGKLACACDQFYRAASYDPRCDDVSVRNARYASSAEMAALHLDVTERAEVATS